MFNKFFTGYDNINQAYIYIHQDPYLELKGVGGLRRFDFWCRFESKNDEKFDGDDDKGFKDKTENELAIGCFEYNNENVKDILKRIENLEPNHTVTNRDNDLEKPL